MKHKLRNKRLLSRIRRRTKTRALIRRLRIPRLCVSRSSRHIQAQVILSREETGNASDAVLAFASTMEKGFESPTNYTGNKAAAAHLGKLIAERALAKGVKKVAFDRSGFRYHGRVAALAEAAREAGLEI